MAAPRTEGVEGKGDDAPPFERREEVALPDGRRVLRVTREYLLAPECPGDRLLCGGEEAARVMLVPPKYPAYMDRFVHEAEKSLWSSLDVNVGTDRKNLQMMMESGDRDKVAVCNLMRKIHGWFAFSEDLIQECVIESQQDRCTIPEERAWLSMQDANEVTHKISYQTVLMALIPDRTERDAELERVKRSPALRAKQNWMRRFTNPAVNTQLEIRVAAACSEAIFFMCSFSSIFAVKPLDVFPGIAHLNDYISRDETRHADQHAYKVRTLVLPEMTPDQRKAFNAMARERVRSAVEAECIFADDLFPAPIPLIALSAPILKQYVRFVGDCVLAKFGVDPLFGDENPLTFMTLMDLPGRENFHDLGAETSEYTKARDIDTDKIDFEGDF